MGGKCESKSEKHHSDYKHWRKQIKALIDGCSSFHSKWIISIQMHKSNVLKRTTQKRRGVAAEQGHFPSVNVQQLRCSRSSATHSGYNPAKHCAESEGSAFHRPNQARRGWSFHCRWKIVAVPTSFAGARSAVATVCSWRSTNPPLRTLARCTWMRILSWKLHYLTWLSACLPLIVPLIDTQTWLVPSCSQKRRGFAAAIAMSPNSPGSCAVLWLSAPRVPAGPVSGVNAWSTKLNGQISPWNCFRCLPGCWVGSVKKPLPFQTINGGLRRGGGSTLSSEEARSWRVSSPSVPSLPTRAVGWSDQSSCGESAWGALPVTLRILHSVYSHSAQMRGKAGE